MESLDGIAKLHMSGARAVFTVEPSADLTEKDVADAFAARGMELESLAEVKRARAERVWLVDAGVT